MKKIANTNIITFAVYCAIGVLSITSLTACSNLVSRQAPDRAISAPSALGNSELFTFHLAQELFANMQPDQQYRYAVAGFVPVTSLQTDLSEQGPLMLLGHQLEQGLITEAVRRGFVAQDFKASNAIIMNNDSDRALSRDLTYLSGLQNIDYYITGTITPQQNGAMVNARVINVRNKDVVAAATSFFPADLFWESEQITLRNGQLYRSEKRPTPPSVNLPTTLE
jgi:TolB-like protein